MYRITSLYDLKIGFKKSYAKVSKGSISIPKEFLYLYFHPGGFVDENLGARSGGGGPRSRDQRRSTNPNVSLSVAGQVQHLIKEATSKENLSQMYIGWGAYL